MVRQMLLLSRALVLLTGCCCLAAGTMAAEVYKVVDENGNVTYTDSPPRNGNAEKIELPEGNRLPPTIVRQRPPSREPTDNPDYRLRITSPPDGFHLNPGMWNLNIQVSVDPPLLPDHELQITDNGKIIEGTTLENIVVRGTHVIQARIVDEQGSTISRSAPIEVYVHRPTVNN